MPRADENPMDAEPTLFKDFVERRMAERAAEREAQAKVEALAESAKGLADAARTTADALADAVEPAKGDRPEGPGPDFRPAIADALMVFHTICGARRIEPVQTPFLEPPPFVDLPTAKPKTIQVPGEKESFETRRFDYVQTATIDPLAIALHLYRERI